MDRYKRLLGNEYRDSHEYATVTLELYEYTDELLCLHLFHARGQSGM
jgi:hypothetical protein